jgi:hypothetical protein
MVEDARNQIETGGGAYADGSVQTAGGDFVGRDQYIQYNQLDPTKLVEALRQVLPVDDPAPKLWVKALNDLRVHHTRLFEWKELHNFLNDILVVLGQFKREVERIDISGEVPNARALSRLWRPVVQKVDAMMTWATSIKYISDQPLLYSEDYTVGPSWAIDLNAAKILVDGVLSRQVLETNEVYDAVFDFSDLAEQHMYLTDKMLRSTAGELFNLSSSILGKISHDQI